MNLLPLGVLARLEGLQDAHHLLQSRDLLLHGSADLGLVATQLLVEVGPVRGCGHGSAEDRLDHPGVMGLEGAAVGMAERGRQLLLRVLEVVPKSLGSEIEAAIDIR